MSAPLVPVRLAYNTYDPIDEVNTSLSPVLFLHGVGASKENWADIPQIVANSTKRKVFSLDARNHGDSEWSDEFTFDINADDLLHFMGTEKINKAVLVGHSMGGITSIKAALKQPDKIEKLIVEDVFVKAVPREILMGVVSYFSLCRKAIEAVPDGLDENGVKKFIMEFIHSSLPPEVQALKKGDRESEDSHILCLKKDENGRYVFKTNLKVIERSLTEESETTNTVPLGKYEGPACFIYGKLSPFKVDSEEENIREHFPNAVFEGVEEATHTVHADCPTEFTDALLKFMS